MWVRWSLPRFRFDQLMNIAWRAMIPIALAQLMLTAALIYWLHVSKGQTPAYGVSAVQAIWFFAMNIAILLGAMLFSVLIPAPPATNRRVRVAGSRFEPTPLPAAS